MIDKNSNQQHLKSENDLRLSQHKNSHKMRGSRYKVLRREKNLIMEEIERVQLSQVSQE